MSSPPVVHPVRDILGENVNPLRVIVPPPKVSGGKSTNGSAHTQRTASSSSLASSEGNPPMIKVEASFIDFDSVPELVVASTFPQRQHSATNAALVQQIASSDNNWANFDSFPEVKVWTPVSNSVESLLLELSIELFASGSLPQQASHHLSFLMAERAYLLVSLWKRCSSIVISLICGMSVPQPVATRGATSSNKLLLFLHQLQRRLHIYLLSRVFPTCSSLICKVDGHRYDYPWWILCSSQTC